MSLEKPKIRVIFQKQKGALNKLLFFEAFVFSSVSVNLLFSLTSELGDAGLEPATG
jgi:hypothetical protein